MLGFPVSWNPVVFCNTEEKSQSHQQFELIAEFLELNQKVYLFPVSSIENVEMPTFHLNCHFCFDNDHFPKLTLYLTSGCAALVLSK